MPCSAAYLQTFPLVCRNLMPTRPRGPISISTLNWTRTLEIGTVASGRTSTNWNEWKTHLSLFCHCFSVSSVVVCAAAHFEHNTILLLDNDADDDADDAMTCIFSAPCICYSLNMCCVFQRGTFMLLHVHNDLVPLCFFCHHAIDSFPCFYRIKIGMQISGMYVGCACFMSFSI